MTGPPPRICQVLYSFNVGGSERLAEQLCGRFAHAGLSVDVCATRSGDGVISKRLKENRHTCLSLDLERCPRLLRPFVKIRFSLWLRRRGVTALLVHHLPMLNDVYLAARFAGIKKIVVVEHTARTLRADRKFRQLAKRVLRLPVEFIAVNPDVESALVEIRPSLSGRVTVIRNGVDTDIYRPGEFPRPGHSTSPIMVGWIGRLHPVKDIVSAIRAFEIACDSTDLDMRMTIIGDGEERNLLEDTIATSSAGRRIDYQGQREDIQVAMRSFDMFLISSTEEGTPLTLLEAMSTGLPIVSTNVGGIPEVVNKDIGVLVNPKDVSAMAGAIAMLATSPDRRTRMGSTARRYVLDNYGLEKATETYLRILDREHSQVPRGEFTGEETKQ